MLSVFPSYIEKWFYSSFRAPTEIQSEGWAKISTGDHVLMSAPTGSGKTLAAFLWSISRILDGTWEGNKVRILYISPLKALNKDVEINLYKPLNEILKIAQDTNQKIQPCRIGLRSGDTKPYEREKLLRNPPEIFITTPESLALLLSSIRGRDFLSGIKAVILDEIHALCSDKRGTSLSTSLERLVEISGEFQRIALSATVNPMRAVADFVAGSNIAQRKVQIIVPPSEKRYDLTLQLPFKLPYSGSWWEPLTDTLLTEINKHRSTLIFVNSRRRVEQICRSINQRNKQDVAYPHHGSLSKEVRQDVESRMKEGKLKAVVATNSLELGIDIGAIDLVILVGTPSTLSGALQKIGRAGHQVGQISKGILIPLHPLDLLSGLILLRTIKEGKIEPLYIPSNPLDMIPQFIIGELCRGSRLRMNLYRIISRSFAFGNLPIELFDRVLSMMSGEYNQKGMGSLKAQILWEREEDILSLLPGSLMRLYMNSGSIPNLGYYTLRKKDSGIPLGELDEEFVWERRIGDRFYLGNQNWQIRRIGFQDVLVDPVPGKSAMTPFWKAENRGWSTYFSRIIQNQINDLTERAAAGDEHFLCWLKDSAFKDLFTTESAIFLAHWLRLQINMTGQGFPSTGRILWETIKGPPGDEEKSIYLHTFWGSRVNATLALAVKELLSQRGMRLSSVLYDDKGLLLPYIEDWNPNQLFQTISDMDLTQLVRKQLAQSGMFGAQFRESAQRSLWITKNSINKRQPRWMTRMKAQQILKKLKDKEDVPPVIEAWRACIEELLDIAHLQEYIEELGKGKIKIISYSMEKPSPLTSNLKWQLTNQKMYASDASEEESAPLSEQMLGELLGSGVYPTFSQEDLISFTKRITLEDPLYRPKTLEEIVLYIQDQLVLERSQWVNWLKALNLEESVISELQSKLVVYKEGKYISHQDHKKLLSHLPDQEEASPFIEKLLRYKAPVTEEILHRFLEDWIPSWQEYLDGMLEEGILYKVETSWGTGLYAHKEVWEHFFRYCRRKRQDQIQSRPLEELPFYLFEIQGFGKTTDLKEIISPLLGYPAKVNLWEGDIFPSRKKSYHTYELDQLLQESPLVFYGTSGERLHFILEDEVEVFTKSTGSPPPSLWPPGEGSFDFWQIKEHFTGTSAQLSKALWASFWKSQITINQYSSLRKAALGGFKVEEPQQNRSRDYRNWSQSRPIEGFWTKREKNTEISPLEKEKNTRLQIHQLLERYGLFSPVFLKLEPNLKYKEVYPQLVRMEWSGELLRGEFFSGLPAPQFIETSKYMQFKGTFEDGFYCINAQDPASLCGLEIPELKGLYPSRIPSTYLMYYNKRLAGILYKKGVEIHLIENRLLGHEEDIIEQMVSFFESKFNQDYSPWKRVRISKINGQRAEESNWGQLLIKKGFKKSYRYIELS